MKKAVLLTAVLAAAVLVGCSGKLSDKYITVNEYEGIEVEKAEVTETTDEEIDKVVARMMQGYTAQHDLPENTEITDEIVKETLSDKAETVEQYRQELKKQIDAAKEEAARSKIETRVWEKVIDNSEVKEYPEDRVKEVKKHLKSQYEAYAKEAGAEYDDYMEALGMTDKELEKAAKASVKQELAAEVIADKYGLKPNDEDFQKALEEYADEYKFANVDLLLEAVPEEEMRLLVTQDNVKSWLADRCKLVEPSEKTKSEDKKETAEKADESAKQ